jgi:hypothetical protein
MVMEKSEDMGAWICSFVNIVTWHKTFGNGGRPKAYQSAEPVN